MNANAHELLFKEESFNVVGAAFNISHTLGCGFLEAVCLEELEIQKKEISVYSRAFAVNHRSCIR